jgi:15-cis-phytoene synthase
MNTMVRTPSHSPLNAQAVMDQHAKSFAWAARFLAASTRHNAALLYAFARTADDYADEAALGSLPERLQHLAQLRAEVLQPQSTDTLASATGRMLQANGVPAAVLVSFMDSLQADAGPRNIATVQDLLSFAYGVAGTVGQMMRPLLGTQPSAEPYAVALGVAMQLTNVARDVVEDAQRQRCYIPAQWGVSAEVLASPQNAHQRQEAFATVQRLLALADDFYAYAHSGIQAIPPSNRRAIRIAAGLYQAIGHKIRKRGADAFWQGRVSLSPLEKSWLIARKLLATDAGPAVPARDVWHSELSHLAGVPGFPA